MSGDVQPRKRKDKRKKQRDSIDRRSEGEFTFSRQSSIQEDDESSHGVHITKMGTEDIHLHVHREHGTGGHWCAKIFFFTLLAVLIGLISLIIMENRGISDLDTPLSESRFSNYFDGWVDEQPDTHDEHDAVQASLEEHDEHDEPFEEEDAISEADDDDDDEEEDEDEGEEAEDDEHDEDNGEQLTKEKHDEKTEDIDNTNENDEDDEDDDDEENENNEENDNDEENDSNAAKEVEAGTVENEDDIDGDDNDDDDDNNDDDNDGGEDEDDNDGGEDEYDNDGGEEVDEDGDEDVKNSVEEGDNVVSAEFTDRTAELNNASENDEDDDDNDGNSAEDITKENNKDSVDPFDEDDDDDDDDDTFENFEKVVDNDAEELLLLQKKAEAQASQTPESDDPASEENEKIEAAEDKPSWISSLAVKLGVGVALALVARLVLLRKNPNTNDEASVETMMKRRLTIAGPEDKFPEDVDAPRLPTDELSEEDEIIEEEIIEFLEEEIEEDVEEEVDEEEEEIEIDEDGVEVERNDKYVPETFEQLNAIYREHQKPSSQPTTTSKEFSTNKFMVQNQQSANQKPPPVFIAPPPPPSKEEITRELKTTTTASENTQNPTIITTSTAKQSKGNVDENSSNQPDADKHNYDDENYDSDEMDEEDEVDDEGDGDDENISDIDDISDVDDTELMSRLDAKYGKLPTSTSSGAKDFESDEDPDDPTWTQIKSKENLDGGGAKAFNDDDDEDSFEVNLNRAQAELARENFAAAFRLFSKIAKTYPDQPRTFYGQCTAYYEYIKRRNIQEYNNIALSACKRYLAFGRDIEDREQYRLVAEIALEIIEYLGIFHQAEDIFENLLYFFPEDIEYMKRYALILLKTGKLHHAKSVLQKILKILPNDGLALAHYGLVLLQLTEHRNEAIKYLQRGIDTNEKDTNQALLYLKLGEAYQRLGKQIEARIVYERAVDLKLIPSIMQRPIYYVPHLRAQPFWSVNETGYSVFLNLMSKHWSTIREEGLKALQIKGYFKDESENLRDSGSWQMFELWAQGRRNDQNCKQAPFTCSLIADVPAVRSCLRGQVKFSIMLPKTHVWPHCGPTNARLRAHLGLVVPDYAEIRVGEEKRTWTEGEFLIFDDSFEHEVWQNGESYRLVLIVDMWHPDLNEKQRESLTPL